MPTVRAEAAASVVAGAGAPVGVGASVGAAARAVVMATVEHRIAAARPGGVAPCATVGASPSHEGGLAGGAFTSRAQAATPRLA